MSPSTFELLLTWVAPLITKKSTRMREPIPPDERLSVTLRYLVTGDAYTTIAASYRISPTTVGRIVQETCDALWNALSEQGFLRVPCNTNDWKSIANDFGQMWNFPHALGALDGKHVVMQAPARSGSIFFNYKKTHSIVLLAVCNARYEFTLVDIGDTGRQADGSVYTNSYLGRAIQNDLLNFPQPEALESCPSKPFPYAFLADDAFGLKPNLMKPYPNQYLPLDERIFNYRLSRARRVIENAFGIATTRFRVFRRPIIATEQKVVLITKAVVALHNFLMSLTLSQRSNSYNYCPANYVDQENPCGTTPGEWRNHDSSDGLIPIARTGSNNYSRTAKQVRDDFKDYFMNEGAVDWQWATVTRT
ncbi:Hypothetical predicted protein [Paramuricea clavata]|uniref:Uncharacterized protein n=1 Tax=Paramuricea clavata TaxID=317549 RepID=A0A6S7HFG6_PARCT|nr:Hypothetical predicted protein [Paramuricea clavata]